MSKAKEILENYDLCGDCRQCGADSDTRFGGCAICEKCGKCEKCCTCKKYPCPQCGIGMTPTSVEDRDYKYVPGFSCDNCETSWTAEELHG